ncbi:hypothetical protein KEM56_006734 [Ascosphaera pollenicola]|nr:hypothetical protein KEM56_006734 [Ascosphaera pollenicola]
MSPKPLSREITKADFKKFLGLSEIGYQVLRVGLVHKLVAYDLRFARPNYHPPENQTALNWNDLRVEIKDWAFLTIMMMTPIEYRHFFEEHQPEGAGLNKNPVAHYLAIQVFTARRPRHGKTTQKRDLKNTQDCNPYQEYLTVRQTDDGQLHLTTTPDQSEAAASNSRSAQEADEADDAYEAAMNEGFYEN